MIILQIHFSLSFLYRFSVGTILKVSLFGIALDTYWSGSLRQKRWCEMNRPPFVLIAGGITALFSDPVVEYQKYFAPTF